MSNLLLIGSHLGSNSGRHPELNWMRKIHQVWTAVNGREALRICGDQATIDIAIIHIPLADQPDLSDFATSLLEIRPGLALLFLVRNKGALVNSQLSLLLPGHSFGILEEPFSEQALSLSLRELGYRLGPQPVAAFLSRLAAANQLVLAAEQAFHSGDPCADSLRLAAGRAHYDLLRTICGFSEAEAERIEPAFTEFEDCLLRLPTGKRTN